MKVEELNRYAEKLQRPTRSGEVNGTCLPSLAVESGGPIKRSSVLLMKTLHRTALCSCSLFSSDRSCQSEPKTILVFGDSLSGGFMLKRSEAYPALLAKKLRAAGLNFSVTNASATGGTTDGGLERLPPHLKHRIDILILELGINDAFRGVPIDQIQNNLQQIIDKVKARNPNARVVIAGMQLPGYAADDYVSAFGQMFADLAAKNRAALVPYLLARRGRQSFVEFVRRHSSECSRPKDPC